MCTHIEGGLRSPDLLETALATAVKPGEHLVWVANKLVN